MKGKGNKGERKKMYTIWKERKKERGGGMSSEKGERGKVKKTDIVG